MAQTPGRIETLDIVRGVAVMGILLLNIVGFGLPEAAYFNPRVLGGAEGADLAAWLINFILFDGKMRGLFSFLFGASMLLVIERAEAEGRNAALVHHARMLWLLAFGLAHLWLVWWGDILAHYALVGMVAFAFRRLPVPRLLGLALCLVLAQSALMAMLAAAAGDAGGSASAGLERVFGIPSPAALAADLTLHRGGYGAIVADRFARHGGSPIEGLWFSGCETLAYMVFGMAALRSGMLTGEWQRRSYVRGAMIGFGIGVPVYAAIALWLAWSDFALFPLVTGTVALTVPVRPPMIGGWVCLILLAIRPGGLTARIAAAGRMAFTNYIATSLICTTIFYGYGLGWYGHLSRAELYAIVPMVCAAMLLWSQPWLARFRYGPFEWLWRSLARGSVQSIRGPAT